MIYFVGNDTILPCCEEASIHDVVKYCEDKMELGVDTETEGLDFICKKMIMFQIGDQDNQFIIDTRVISIEPLRDVLERRDIVKIFHNAKFDYKFIKKWADITCQGVYDTFLVELVNNCGKGIKYGLKDLCNRYFNVELNKEVRNKFIGLNGTPFTEGQITYGAKDVEYLCKIKELQTIKTIENKLENVVQLENEVVLAFADIEYNGLDLDIEQWKTLENINDDKAKLLEQKLDTMILDNKDLISFVTKYVQGDLFVPIDNIRKVNINWSSPIQVLKAFQIFIPKLENVNGKEIYKYRFKHTIIDTYIKYKEAMKLCTSYGDKFLKNLSADNKIHTNFHQILDTGRVSSSKPNMQQIPADNIYRNCFKAPNNWSFVSADYSSQELNVIAFGSKDPVWLEALEEGQDLHSTCAELVYGEKWLNSAEDDCAFYVPEPCSECHSTNIKAEWIFNICEDCDHEMNQSFKREKCNCPKHKKLRTNVKTINFGLAYGMGPNKLANTLNINVDAAKILINKYFKAFPAIKGFLEKLGNFGKRYGYIKTFPPYNRRRWFTNWYPKMWDNKSSSMELGSIERASKNTPIQGASADMTKKALVLMRDYINKYDLNVKLVMTVHDQIDTICKNDEVEYWAALMADLMNIAAKEIVTNGLLKAEVTISNCWEK